MTILIVDDDAGIRALITLVLARHGYQATSVPNGHEALTYLHDHERLPELILLDGMMPVMDGAAFLRTQQADAHLAGIPVIVISADENIHAQVPPLTAATYLPKPIDFAALIRLVAHYCSQSRQRGM